MSQLQTAGAVPGESPQPAVGPIRRSGNRRRDVIVWVSRFIIVATFLIAWEEVPKIPGITNVFSFADPFFISSPTKVAHELRLLTTGENNSLVIWSPLLKTVVTAMIGTFLALALGAIAGLAVSTWRTLERISKPFIVVLNAVPRIAIIPIIVLLVSSTEQADALTAFTVVFFLVFYNAAEGAASVPLEMIQNAELLGASRLRVMWKVRWPYTLAWTFAALPNAIAFGLTGTITAELFTGGTGLGYQLVLGIDNSNATLLFAVVVVVAVIGVILVLGSALLRRLLLPWWETSGGM